MKTTLLFLMISTFCFGQKTAEYGKLKKTNSYKSYISKNGNRLNIGDTLIIGEPGGHRFKYITRGPGNLRSWIAGDKVTITKFKVRGNKNEFILLVAFNDVSIPPLIKYELALASGEVINPKVPLTKLVALNKLKEQKNLLDLDLITQTEYDKIKAELGPIILSDK